MKIYGWRVVVLISLLALLTDISAEVRNNHSNFNKTAVAQGSNPQVITPSFMGITPPLRDIPPVLASLTDSLTIQSLRDNLTVPPNLTLSDGSFDPPQAQKTMGVNAMPAPVANFDGISNINGVLPPDTQGDIGYDATTGKRYYVQWVNLSFEIWDVTNPSSPVSLVGPIAGNTLWSGTGTLCASHNNGDPITQYDQLANRWFMSQFAISNPNDYHQCIAVSKTADPTGQWYVYDFQTSTLDMNDYPKFGVWPDGYYMSVNQYLHGISYDGVGVAVFERSAMLAGQIARMIYFEIPATTNYYSMLPSDAEGNPPAPGTPNYFAEWDDSSQFGDSGDTIRIWQFHVDWTTPANSTFGLNSSFAPNQKITTTNVNPNMCNYARSCIPQPGTSQGVDAISYRLMYRLQYRVFNGYQSLVGNHTINFNSTNVAGIHWFELRNLGSGFGMYQQGVFSPDTSHRWMGSIAMDSAGNIALGYSVSSSSTFPTVRYVGRLATDPLNTMPQGETSLVAGTGSQTNTAARWGDYSMMSVDPFDGCTFWYTQEYLTSTGNAPWKTRIGSFTFPSCTPPTTVTLEGTVTDVDSAPIPGASVSASAGYSTITDAAGHFALTLPDGIYDISITKYGYMPKSTVVVMPSITKLDVTLEAAPVFTLTGVVTDGLANWPLYARIDIAGYPGSPIFTDPVTGIYQLELAEGQYSLSVKAMSGGYEQQDLTFNNTVNTTQNFTLVADPNACSAPGYGLTTGAAQSAEAACSPVPGSGLVVGAVFDANTNLAIPAPLVQDVALNQAVIVDNSLDVAQAHPIYIINEPGGSVSLTASAPFYLAEERSTEVVENSVVRQDFILAAGKLTANPNNLVFKVNVNHPNSTAELSLSNIGGIPASLQVFTIPDAYPANIPAGPFADHTRHFGPANLNDLDASQMRIDLTPVNIPKIKGGNVITSWLTGLNHAWGIGFNQEAADLWLGDLATAGGDGLLHRFMPDGSMTTAAIGPLSWVTAWNADLTYNPITKKIWQANVGGDDCIYELDPATRLSTGGKICPPFGTSERGLAFDPRTNTYFAGSWNDGIINHFGADGTMLDSAAVNLSIAGLAYNPSTRHLFALANNAHPENQYDVYVLDTQNGYEILGGFNITENGMEALSTSGQAGMELDCQGNLWVVDQNTQKVYVAESGETGVCDWQATWLTVNPSQGDVSAGGNISLTVAVEAAGLTPGRYQGYLRVVSNTPYEDTIVEVSLTIMGNLFLPTINR